MVGYPIMDLPRHVRTLAKLAGATLLCLPAWSAGAEEDAGLPWWRQVVFYEVFVRSFADSTAGPLAGDGIGDLQGLIERLDYLNDGDPSTDEDLGVGALWLMPIMESPSYHGYDVRDYRAVEKDYGTLDDFSQLIRESHRRGMRVILDLVINHTSRQHPWFRDAYRARSPYHGWYIWSREKKNYRGPWNQPVWHQLAWWQRGWKHFNYLAYYGIFSPSMPDLDLSHPGATRAMHAVARFWLEDMAADGFRLDAVRHLIEDGATQADTEATHEWLRGFFAAVKEAAPEAVLVGEAWADTETVASYRPDQVDLAFQFGLASAVLETAKDGEPEPLAEEIDRVWNSFPPGQFATFLANHDQMRVATYLAGDRDRAALAATLLLTLPGVPFVYYGEEIGMVGAKPDPRIRTPMQWTPGRRAGFSSHRPWQRLQIGHERVNVETQARDPGSLLALYRRLIRLRGGRPSLAVGGYSAVDAGHPRLFAFRRSTSSEATLVLCNLGEEPVSDYGLALEPSGIAGAAADLLHDTPIAAFPVGDEAYRPIAELAPLKGYVLALPSRFPASNEAANGSGR